jgi:hypothetical protein
MLSLPRGTARFDQGDSMGSSFGFWHFFIFVFWIGVFAIPMWRIAVKAGFPGPVSLLMYIPVLNIILLWVFAFVRWPVERNRARDSAGM